MPQPKQTTTTKTPAGVDVKTPEEVAAAAEAAGIDFNAIRLELDAVENPLARLHGKIAWVQQHVGQVEKTGNVSFGGTSFDVMQEHGLIQVLRPLWRVVGLSVIGGAIGPSSHNRSGNSAIVDFALTVTDITTGEAIVRWYPNEGVDKADKAFNKAYTGGMKYALQKFFLVPTMSIDDNETLDVESTRGAGAAAAPAAVQAQAAGKVDPAEANTLRETIKASSMKGAAVRNHLTANYGVSVIENLTPAQFGEFAGWVAGQISAGGTGE